MSIDQREEWNAQARAALIIAAMRRSILTYGELGTALGIEGVALRNQLRHVLDDVSKMCFKNNEPPWLSWSSTRSLGSRVRAGKTEVGRGTPRFAESFSTGRQGNSLLM